MGYAINNNGSLEGVARKFSINYTPLLAGTRFYTFVVQRAGSAFEKRSEARLPRPRKCTEQICTSCL